MAVAAFVVSLFALGISAGSFFYARRTAGINAARRYEERVPVLRGGVEPLDPWYMCQVWVELCSAETVDRLDIAVSDASVLVFGPLDAASAGLAGDQARWPHPLAAGDRATWAASVNGGGGVTVRARVTCYRGRQRWTVPVDLDLPYDITPSVH